jgi:hypothetical protein
MDRSGVFWTLAKRPLPFRLVPNENQIPGKEGLPALTAKISAALETRPEVFITHPVELKILKSMTKEELDDYTVEHGWRIVRRIGCRQIEFYKDVGALLRAEE